MGELAKPQIICHAEHSTDMTLFDCRWVPSSARFVVAGTALSGTGILRVYQVTERGDIVKYEREKDSEDSSLTPVSDIERKQPFKCITFGASSLETRQPATGDFDGNIEVWDLENSRSVWNVKGHASIVNAIDGVGGGALGHRNIGAPELVTGSRDGTVKVWDVRIRDKPVACMQPEDGQAKRDCWTVAFGNAHDDTDRMVAAGYDNGDVKVFDLRTLSLHWDVHLSNGVCSLAFDRPDIMRNKLMATCLEGKVHLWDMKTKHVKAGYAMHEQRIEKARHTVWGGRFLRQNREVFATLGGGGSLTLWKYKYPAQRVSKQEDGTEVGVAGTMEKLQESQIADQPISGFDWSPDKTGLAVTTSFDQKIRLVIVTKLNTL